MNQKDIEEINDELEDPACERQELDRLRRVAEQELKIIHSTTGSHHSRAEGAYATCKKVKNKGESGEKSKENRKERDRKKEERGRRKKRVEEK